METERFFLPLTKVGWQAERALWQEGRPIVRHDADPHGKDPVPLIGGISYTTDEMTQMWYPSDRIHDKYGVLTGAYSYPYPMDKHDVATKWGRLEPKERLRRAREGAKNLHGEKFARGRKDEYGVAIAWQNVPFHCGGFTRWEEVGKGENEDGVALCCYNQLTRGNKNFYVVGDQISQLPAWKEGAITSALNVLAQITGIKGYTPQDCTSLPDSTALLVGDNPR